MLVLALDVGTSSTRARCYGAGGAGLAGVEGRRQYEAAPTAEGGVELEAPALLEAVAGAVDDCLEAAGRRAAEIGGVGVSAFWHGLLGLDGAGRPLTPVLTWADTRSAGAAGRLRRELDEPALHARTGCHIHPCYFPAKLAWLRERDPARFRSARVWCGAPEYLAARLFGVAPAALRWSLSMASGTGLLDHEGAAWHRPLLEHLDLDPARLPEIGEAPWTGLAAPFARRWPSLARVPWFPAWGDGACSSVGSDAGVPGRLALNLGTSSALRLVTRAAPAPPRGLWHYRVDAARHLLGGATSEGGNVVTWCHRTLRLPDDPEALDRAVSALPPGAGGLIALPFLAGERSPGWRAEARGALVGLGLATGPVEILRALMEAVAHRLALIHERLVPLAAPGAPVIASGGALLASRAWQQILADALGVPLRLSQEQEASSRGAALLALERLGAPPPPPLPPGPTVEPDPGRHAHYRAARERQRHLYDSVVGLGVS
jgi:gluconokinase